MTSGSPELGHAFVAEAIADMIQEVAAVRLGLEELWVLILRKVEVPVDVTTSERR